MRFDRLAPIAFLLFASVPELGAQQTRSAPQARREFGKAVLAPIAPRSIMLAEFETSPAFVPPAIGLFAAVAADTGRVTPPPGRGLRRPCSQQTFAMIGGGIGATIGLLDLARSQGHSTRVLTYTLGIGAVGFVIDRITERC